MDEKSFSNFLEYYKTQLKWYDDKSIVNKKIFERLQKSLIILTIITPVFIVVEISIMHEFAYVSLVFTVIVAIMASFQRTFRYRDYWLIYRNVRQRMISEKHFYDSRIYEYHDTDDPEALFVRNIERLISQEGEIWLTATNEGLKNSKTEHD